MRFVSDGIFCLFEFLFFSLGVAIFFFFESLARHAEKQHAWIRSSETRLASRNTNLIVVQCLFSSSYDLVRIPRPGTSSLYLVRRVQALADPFGPEPSDKFASFFLDGIQRFPNCRHFLLFLNLSQTVFVFRFSLSTNIQSLPCLNSMSSTIYSCAKGHEGQSYQCRNLSNRFLKALVLRKKLFLTKRDRDPKVIDNFSRA